MVARVAGLWRFLSLIEWWMLLSTPPSLPRSTCGGAGCTRKQALPLKKFIRSSAYGIPKLTKLVNSNICSNLLQIHCQTSIYGQMCCTCKAYICIANFMIKLAYLQPVWPYMEVEHIVFATDLTIIMYLQQVWPYMVVLTIDLQQIWPYIMVVSQCICNIFEHIFEFANFVSSGMP